MAHDLIFAACVDWLTPREYDGRALLRLPADDPRRRVDRALAAEIRTAVGLLERLADVFLVPLKEYLSKSAHRDKLGLFVQRAVLVPVGTLTCPAVDGCSSCGQSPAPAPHPHAARPLAFASPPSPDCPLPPARRPSSARPGRRYVFSARERHCRLAPRQQVAGRRRSPAGATRVIGPA
eukprot:scaffold10546_cov114-Isochrysis_galbana.AAC.3